MEIRVYKSKRILELWNGESRLATYPIGIGRNDLGHKERKGDFRTPEGEYEICVKNPRSKFHLGLGLNYPNRADAEAGLRDGIITEQEHREIMSRLESGCGSLWSTALGGEIYIHGDLESKNWSEGCVRMFNRDIESLYHQVEVGTKVVIQP